jgi:hypothetical protein
VALTLTENRKCHVVSIAPSSVGAYPIAIVFTKSDPFFDDIATWHVPSIKGTQEYLKMRSQWVGL